MSASDLFITGTDTDVGKTVLSALLCAALNRCYWKPIQTGTSEGSDREAVMGYAAIPEKQTLPEIYRFEPPVSPHLAARLAGTRIDVDTIVRPSTSSPLVIEGAGGVLVPINERDLMVDLMKRLKAPVVLAARTALGTINHTLLSIRTLREAGLTVKGVVIIGPPNDDNRRAIEHYGDIPVIGWIPVLPCVDHDALVGVYSRYFRRDSFT
jgi:dethiobiotin synthase